MHFTYIIRCMDNSLYTGYTTDIKRRMKEHERGINSKYTRVRGYRNLEIFFISDSRSKAMKLESYIKRCSRIKKLWIIENGNEFIQELENKLYYSLGKIEELK
ncbi:GIY-YIG nuclease family protein [Romboutsia lituseburensis]|uniref:GIY-YIG nuclease family protein n=1 Tax=Romboutsia lituseburensis TaxID=1537 RepID=UPI00215A84BB|nr:GIY-YIG nuclease family protein [Romboutsia lituseburensis]MCR8744863.1 GIY-YIG nuclease family protein [Romboutsia lituseburensis]